VLFCQRNSKTVVGTSPFLFDTLAWFQPAIAQHAGVESGPILRKPCGPMIRDCVARCISFVIPGLSDDIVWKWKAEVFPSWCRGIDL
jgi:hypothetical protein